MEFIEKRYLLILACIPIISLALHFHVLDRDLLGYHVWRQTETQTVINNFYTEDLNILNPRINDRADTDRIHRMEFPFMQWLFALFYKLFGSHIAISRILTFLIGLGSVYGMFYLCNNIFRNKAMAVICAWCFNCSPVFYYYTINPMPDNMALCCGIWSIGLFYAYLNTQKMKYVLWSAFFLASATLAKLPFILYGAFIFAFFAVQLKRREYNWKQLLQCLSIYILFALPHIAWYATVIPQWGHNPIVKGIFETTMGTAELNHIFWATLYSTLPELLINYGSVLFFIAGFYFLFRNRKQHHKYFPLFIVWGAVLILYFLFEMNAIALIHDYYLFPFLPAIFLLVAYGAYYLLLRRNTFLGKLSLLCLAILPLTAFLRADPRWDTATPEFNPVYYHNKEQLRNLIPDNALCIVGNDDSHYILLYYINRKGWAFDNDNLDESSLTYFMNHGAKYLFTDSRIDDKPEIKTHLAEKIFEQETVRVYKLK
ncbi:MAG: hypothetical protein K0Q79_644 [Flavipsychrobacter sp.]|jgi:hypothetical protein|nr:hypothetical protein [Flavipsychrobacter sp.]